LTLSGRIKVWLVAAVVLSTFGMSILGSAMMRRVVQGGIEERVRALAGTVAARISPDEVAAIPQGDGALSDPAFLRIEERLHSVVQANADGATPVRLCYLLVPTRTGAASGWDFAVDGEPRSSPAWDSPGRPLVVHSSTSAAAQIGASAVIPGRPFALFIEDSSGQWISGFAPIRTNRGDVVALVAADIPYAGYLAEVDQLLVVSLAASALISLLVFAGASLGVSRLLAPIERVRAFIAGVSEGRVEQRLAAAPSPEYSALYGELNAMADTLQKRQEVAQRNLQLVRDVSKQQERLKSIAEVDESLNQIQDIDILIERILAEARELTRCDAGSVMLRDGDDLILSFVQNDTLAKRLESGKSLVVKSLRIPVHGRSIAGYAATSGHTVVIDDAYTIPEDKPYAFNQEVDRKSGYRTRSILSVPLRSSAGRNIGVLQLLNPLNEDGTDRVGFSPDDLESIAHFASAATVALERAALTRSIVLRMISMAEMRDPTETGAHVNRVAGYSVILYEQWARRRALPEDRIQRERDLLRIVAMLHDVGKVGIPDAILKKPGRLTAEEYAVMKTHTIVGARLFGARDSALDQSALDVALHHHERWDGGGYPGDVSVGDDQKGGAAARGGEGARLLGDAIPLFARIVAVADVFDALSSKRKYKESWPEERVLTEMKANAGTQFDPELVDILLQHIEEIRVVSSRYENDPEPPPPPTVSGGSVQPAQQVSAQTVDPVQPPRHPH
jgi:HD-GYP domain-containing protein (c-di-GMP phosphodiesterase class II)